MELQAGIHSNPYTSTESEDELSELIERYSDRITDSRELLQHAVWASEQFYRIQVNNRATELEEIDFFQEKCEKVAMTQGKIVGVRFYRGVVHSGELVTLQREPSNPYDCLAIRVLNMGREQVGHIKKETAAILAQALDIKSPFRLSVDAVVPVRGNSVYDMWVKMEYLCLPVAFPFYSKWICTRSHAPCYRIEWSWRKLRPMQKVTRIVESRFKSQAELDSLFETTQKVKEEIQDLVPGWCKPIPTQLYEFQVKGVSWMINREKEGLKNLPVFWSEVFETNQIKYLNALTNASYPSRPHPVCGGILADQMGLGKTLQMISLIIHHPPGGVSYNAVSDQPSADDVMTNEIDRIHSLKVAELKNELREANLSTTGKKAALVDRLCKFVKLKASSPKTQSPRGTLVIAPKGLLHTWANQIESHVANGVLKVYIYHGSTRNFDIGFLEQFDVVLTTYGTISSEFTESTDTIKRSRQSGPLNMKWWRVILDEAHIVRNRNTKSFKAVCALAAENRWAVTGTPFCNSLDDFQALLSFLKVSPVDKYALYKRAIGRPILEGSHNALRWLRVFIHTYCLKRNKETALQLPPMEIELQKLPISGHQKEVYDTLMGAAQCLFQSASSVSQELVMKNYMMILECITRIRQACLDPSLVPSERLLAANRILEHMHSEDIKGNKTLSEKDATDLFEKLKNVFVSLRGDDNNNVESEEETPYECAICFEVLSEEKTRILRACKHCFCASCLTQLKKYQQKCPLCRSQFCNADIIDVQELKAQITQSNEPIKKEQVVNAPKESPVKIAALINNLHEAIKYDPSKRFLVFSSFTTFLDTIGEELMKESITFTRIDGRMTTKARSEAEAEFQKPSGGPMVMLMSLKAGGLGLTLTRASTVFMMDPWWSPAAEEQCYDRVHRISQLSPVKIIRFVIKDSIEERVLEIQREKTILGKKVLENKISIAEHKAARYRQLHSMFNLRWRR